MREQGQLVRWTARGFRFVVADNPNIAVDLFAHVSQFQDDEPPRAGWRVEFDLATDRQNRPVARNIRKLQ